MINQLPSFQQALQALRVRKKQSAPMRVLAAACRFLGRLLFLLGLSCHYAGDNMQHATVQDCGHVRLSAWEALRR